MSKRNEHSDEEHEKKLFSVIHQPNRLMIMSILMVLDEADASLLVKKTGLVWGTLSSHMSKLEEAEYIEVDKRFVGEKKRKTRTTYKLTEKGKQDYELYRKKLVEVLNPKNLEMDE